MDDIAHLLLMTDEDNSIINISDYNDEHNRM